MGDITISEAREILSEGHLEPDMLKRFPYGELLFRLWTRDDDDGKEYQVHGPKVLQNMNTLLGLEPHRLLRRDPDNRGRNMLQDTQAEIGRHFQRFDEDAQMLFRLAALYHDIGKYIIKERHPTIGWYTMEYLNPDDKKDLLALLNNREDYLQLLMILVRDHDEFGVLSTGEASYPILLRAATSLGTSRDDEERIISAIMWLNLADVAGTANLDINLEDLKKIIDDWHWFSSALAECASTGKHLDDYVIQQASDETLVIERISRLILEACRDVPGRQAELRKPIGSGHVVSQLVRNQLHTVYPTHNPRREFAVQFTHVCKLDYGKRFFSTLVDYCEGPITSSGKPNPNRRYAKERKSTEDLIYAVLAILRRITSTYLAMVRSDGDVGNLIGVEMKDLTPRNAPEKTAQIIELLLQSHYPGLSWMMSDCLAWYF